MDLPEVTSAAFYDELEKIAISHKRLTVSQSRSGRRPMRVDTLLRKEKDGTLFKNTGNEQKIAGMAEFINEPTTGAEAKPPKRKGDLPSRVDDTALPKREDGRGNATTVLGPGAVTLDVTGRERSA